MGYVIAHDVGTGGNKAALISSQGVVLESEFEPYATQYPHAQCAEQDPEDWWRAVSVTSQRLLDKTQVSPRDVLAISFSYQMLGVLPVDKQAQPLRPCIIWLDGRAVEEADRIMRMFGGPGIFASLFGVALTGKDVLPKLLWLKKHETEIYQRAASILDVGGYLLLQATGRKVYEWTGASASGLFNLKTKSWDGMMMRLFGLESGKFPDLVQSTENVGGLTSRAAAELGLLEGTPVIAGAGDAPLAAVGSGAVGEGDGHVYLGTSGWVGMVTSRRVTGKRGIATIQAADSEKLFLIAETETAGACLEWAAQELYGEEPSHEIFARMDAEVADTDPGSKGLLFAPWMYGERCPVADECVRSAFLNLNRTHKRQHMTRAIYEGVAYNLCWMLDSMAELYKLRPDPLRAIGGGARGLPWLQIIADVSGRTVESVPAPQEATARGAGLVAAIGLGIYPSFEAVKQVVEPEHVLTANEALRPVYEELYPAYRQIYKCLRDFYHSLNKPAAVSGH